MNFTRVNRTNLVRLTVWMTPLETVNQSSPSYS